MQVGLLQDGVRADLPRRTVRERDRLEEEETQLSSAGREGGGGVRAGAGNGGGAGAGRRGAEEEGEGQVHSKSNRCVESPQSCTPAIESCVCPVSEARSA